VEYLEIKNWRTYQHYSDRRPPWIKLHDSILDDYEFSHLTETARLVYLLMLLLAGKTDNAIPRDMEWISRKVHVGVKETQNAVETLVSQRFVLIASCKHSDSKALSPRARARASDSASVLTSVSEEKKEGIVKGRKAVVYSPEFMEFWAAYPRQAGKGDAWAAWQKIAEPVPDVPTLLAAVAAAAKTEQWKRDDKRFIPHPATWLNQRRWEDSPTEAPDPCKIGHSNNDLGF